MCKVFGGPDNYEGTSIFKAHARLRIQSEAFAEVATLLQETLEDAGISDEDVATILGKVMDLRSQIVAPTVPPPE